MITNYLKIAWRSLKKNKSFNLINIFGLTLGISCSIMIFLWIMDEEQIDNFHKNRQTLYSLYQTISSNGIVKGNYSTPTRFDPGNSYPTFLVDNLKKSIPEIQYQVFYATGYELPWGHPETFQVKDKKVKLEGSRASKDFFQIFDYPILIGDPATALNDISSIAISRKMAETFYGSPQEAIGKTIRYENRQDFIISTVFENISPRSSLKFDFLFNWEAQKSRLEWVSNDFRTFIQLSEKSDVNVVQNKINRFLKPLITKKGQTINIGLQKFGDQYLYNRFMNGKPQGGRIEYVRLFSAVALFTLLMACINFMNLATARSIKRAKEIGVRKVVGSSRINLIIQFLGESLLLSLISGALSILLTFLLLNSFNQFSDKQIPYPHTNLVFWFGVLVIIFLAGIVAGSYPAIYLSSLKPIKILKGIVGFSKGTTVFRQSLTIFQFVVSFLLLVATLVIIRQTIYIKNADLGYDKENLIYVRIEGKFVTKDNYLTFKEQALNLSSIVSVDRSTETPHTMGFLVDDKGNGQNRNPSEDAINWQGKEMGNSVPFHPASVGFDFVKLMNLKITEGRDFSKANAADSVDAYIVNKEAVKQMAMKDPIGKWISAWSKKGKIIGILENYHTNSLHEPIKPIILDIKENEAFGVILIRSKKGQVKQAINSLKSLYENLNPDYPFSFKFVDQDYERLYNNEQILSKLSILFSGIAISISCLGLLGLIMFSVEQRTKEIGIRKVLGSTENQIVLMLSKDFLKLLGFSLIIGCPVSWFIIRLWLQDFAYKISLSAWIFMVAALGILIITLLTISFQAYKASLMNPIGSLRSE